MADTICLVDADTIRLLDADTIYLTCPDTPEPEPAATGAYGRRTMHARRLRDDDDLLLLV
jgi:hypothetical protein